MSKRSKRAPAPESGAVHPHKLKKIQLANVPPPEKWHKIQLANAPPPEKWHIPVRQSLLNKGSAASVNAKLRKNLPIDTIARKDLPKGLLSVTRNNPPIDEEGADVSVATVAAAPNTTVYLAKYGSGHYCPGKTIVVKTTALRVRAIYQWQLIVRTMMKIVGGVG